MSNPVSTVDSAPAASAQEAPAPDDGWRSGGLPALRAELDRIDDAVHDLLMQRAEIIEYVARSGKPAAFRPGREASIIRRLLHRHQGSLPPVTLVRIWRELLAGTTAMQGGFSVTVGDPGQNMPLTPLAREHFGALTPLQAYADPAQALEAVSQGRASAAVLPLPSATQSWWLALPRHEPRLYIIGRLPFWTPRPLGFPAVQALVVAATPADASGSDRSFLALESETEISRTHVSEALTTVGFKLGPMSVVQFQGLATTHMLVEVEGYLSEDDSRLRRIDTIVRGLVVLGSYAMPVAGGAE